ncbi:hypothetical protein F4692_003758 [Nocardioides cavernae]|uniref:Uncharacterized protein n=1 Tax=Nocardioides cavernae TaxID=1921566 RepID=A0A7Y9KV78_9ACTN|nr:hypothetical protein [Nocardioides cavernae]NYE38608.1 hypothetical protein [Nocardioides cavernae]
MRTVHPLMVLAAFSLAAVVVHVLVVAALEATSVLPRDARETRDDEPAPDRRSHVPH